MIVDEKNVNVLKDCRLQCPHTISKQNTQMNSIKEAQIYFQILLLIV